MHAADFGGTCADPSYIFNNGISDHCCCSNGCCVSGCDTAEEACIAGLGPVEWILDDGGGRARYRLYWKGKSIAIAGYLYQCHTGD